MKSVVIEQCLNPIRPLYLDYFEIRMRFMCYVYLFIHWSRLDWHRE